GADAAPHASPRVSPRGPAGAPPLGAPGPPAPLSPPPTLGEIAGHLGETAVPAGRVMDGGEHHAGPEALAVLPDPPALLFVAPPGEGDLQLELRAAGGHVLRKVESGKGLAEDLLHPVAIDRLGACVPGGDS